MNNDGLCNWDKGVTLTRGQMSLMRRNKCTARLNLVSPVSLYVSINLSAQNGIVWLLVYSSNKVAQQQGCSVIPHEESNWSNWQWQLSTAVLTHRDPSVQERSISVWQAGKEYRWRERGESSVFYFTSSFFFFVYLHTWMSPADISEVTSTPAGLLRSLHSSTQWAPAQSRIF